MADWLAQKRAHYSWIVNIVLRASPILFRSTVRFQYQHMEEGSGPLNMNLYGNLNRANEVAEHIINDFVMWARLLAAAFIPHYGIGKNVQEVV